MKVIITGAAGFIGYHVAAKLLDSGIAVVGIDNLSPYYDVALKMPASRGLRARPVSPSMSSISPTTRPWSG